MPVLAALFGVLAGGFVWLVVDPIQSRAIGDIFVGELENELEQQARESMIRFDNLLQSYPAVTRLLANHRRMADYLEPVFWFRDDYEPGVIYQDTAPAWLPDGSIWRVTVQPSHVLLVDVYGEIREQYRLRKTPLPEELLSVVQQERGPAREHGYLTKLDDQPYLLVSNQVRDASYNIMGSLVLLVPIDAEFLIASQQRISSTSSLVAILDADTHNVLSSSNDHVLFPGTSIEDSKDEYVVTAQSFFDYGESTVNLLFATFVPRDVISATGQRVLDVERRHRLTGAAIITGIFVLLFILVSSRISRLLRRITVLSNRALDLEQQLPSGGNQLLIMEDWMRGFLQMVMKAREEMRVRHAAEIEEREALKTAVLETSLDPIVTIDQKGRIIDFNPTAENIFGHRWVDVLGKQLDSLIFTTGSRDAFNIQLLDCLNKRDQQVVPAQRTLSALNKEGNEIPVEVAIQPIMLEQTLLFTVYIRDISDRKRQAQEIASLAAFPSESPMPVLRINRPGVVIYANNASAALLKYWGCGRMQTIPIYWKQIVEKVLENGAAREVEVQTDEGIFSLLLAPVRSLEYVNIYGRDITAVRLAEEEARQRQNELIHVSRLSTMGEMATGIAHELNQPLSAIVNFANGCARRLRLDIGSKDDLLGAMRQISDQANRAGEIIKRMRGMVTREQPVRQEVDINELVNDVCALVAYDRRKLEIAIERRLSDVPLSVRVDAVQIEQVLLNLLRNAFDALAENLPNRRRLTIRTGISPGGAVFVSVRDNGVGVKPEDINRLFDPFFTTKKTGMGMGLSISQTILLEHKGKIRVDSLPGKGTTFTVELPPYRTALESMAS